MVDESKFTPPKQTSDRDYEEPQAAPIVLFPMSPREKEIVAAFRRTIIEHFSDTEGKSPEEVLDGLALDLWRLTRK